MFDQTAVDITACLHPEDVKRAAKLIRRWFPEFRGAGVTRTVHIWGREKCEPCHLAAKMFAAAGLLVQLHDASELKAAGTPRAVDAIATLAWQDYRLPVIGVDTAKKNMIMALDPHHYFDPSSRADETGVDWAGFDLELAYFREVFAVAAPKEEEVGP